MTTTTIDKLRPGHEYPGESVNSRTAYRDAEIKPLAALLLHERQLYPLLVCSHPKKPGVHFVVDGNRRRLAFEHLVKTGDILPDYEIEIKDLGEITPTEALRKSWASNETVPLHPADRATVFAKMNSQGDMAEIIAERHGMTIRAVQQSIALGATLAPEIIQAWRDNEITREIVEIFTLAESPEAQVEAFAWAKEQWPWMNRKEIDTRELRRKFMRNKEPVMKRLLGFVGKEAYLAAGGILNEDFFSGGAVVQDMRLLNKLAKQKTEETVARMIAEGWQWAEVKLAKSLMNHGYGEAKIKPVFTSEETKRLKEIEREKDAMMNADEDAPFDGDAEERLDIEAERINAAAQMRAFTEKERAKYGVLVTVMDDGSLDYKPGLIKRAESKSKKSSGNQGGGGYAQPEPEPLNYQVRNALGDWQDSVARELLSAHPREALVMFLATLNGSRWNSDSPMRPDRADVVMLEGFKNMKFDLAYGKIKKLTPEQLLHKMGRVAAQCVDISDHRNGRKQGSGVKLLIDVIGEKAFGDALAKRFDAKLYFNGASKQHILGVYKEALGEDARKAAETTNLEALRKEAIAAVPKTGWLPPELRTSLYKKPTPQASNVTKLDAKKKKAKPAKAAKPKRKAA